MSALIPLQVLIPSLTPYGITLTNLFAVNHNNHNNLIRDVLCQAYEHCHPLNGSSNFTLN